MKCFIWIRHTERELSGVAKMTEGNCPEGDLYEYRIRRQSPPRCVSAVCSRRTGANRDES